MILDKKKWLGWCSYSFNEIITKYITNRVNSIYTYIQITTLLQQVIHAWIEFYFILTVSWKNKRATLNIIKALYWDLFTTY